MRYVVHGLGLESELPLPELPAWAGAADACVRLGAVADAPAVSSPEAAGASFWEDAPEASLRIEGTGAFRVRGGQEIVVDPDPGADPRLLRLSLLGPVLALLLHQRGHLVLHANAVEIGGRAVAFLGPSGQGKSTLAAAFHARGRGLIADDITAVVIGEAGPRIVPGVPRLKLWPESLPLLGCDASTLPRLHPRFEKRGWAVPLAHLPDLSFPLDRLYVLVESESEGIDPLGTQEGMVELVRHWYGGRFPGRPPRRGPSPAYFQRCAAVARKVPLFRLRRIRSLEALSGLSSRIEGHVGSE